MESTTSLRKLEKGLMESKKNFNEQRVYLAEADHNQYAIKIIDKTKIVDEKLRDCIKTEIQTMKLLRHPYVVRLYEVMISSRGIILVMEYVKGGDFFDKISKIFPCYFVIIKFFK